MNSLRSDDGLYIGHWMQQRTREKLAATNKRQLIWVAKALLDGSAGTREDLLALFNIQTNVLMLTFVGSVRKPDMVHHDSPSAPIISLQPLVDRGVTW